MSRRKHSAEFKIANHVTNNNAKPDQIDGGDQNI